MTSTTTTGSGTGGSTDSCCAPRRQHQHQQLPCRYSYLLTVAYDGFRYRGFQRQSASAPASRVTKRPRYLDNGRKQSLAAHTIQDCLEEALLGLWPELTLETLRLRVAGRTDAGVHARGQVVAIDVAQPLTEGDPPSQWQTIRSINSRLPSDVSVERIQPCRLDFHPRQEAIKKQYSYTLRYRRKVLGDDGTPLPICQSGVHTIRRPHDAACLWLCPWALDDSAMAENCQALSGQHDFYAFVHKEERNKRSNDVVLETFSYNVLEETREAAPVVTAQFFLEAKGFRRSMVRNLIGLLVDHCRGEVSAIERVWEANEEAARLVNAAPACGLCLEQVWFNPCM